MIDDLSISQVYPRLSPCIVFDLVPLLYKESAVDCAVLRTVHLLYLVTADCALLRTVHCCGLCIAADWALLQTAAQ